MSGLAPVTRESSAALVERIRAGDARAFETLFRTYHAPLCGFAYRFVRAPDVAEELVQEVFLFIWERRQSWDVRDNVKTYLFTSVRNAAMSYLRHEQVVHRHETQIGPLQERSVADTAQHTEVSELAVAVGAAVKRLPERCQMVFRLHREQGLSYAEIAKVLAIAPKTVEVQMGRALKSLRKALVSFR